MHPGFFRFRFLLTALGMGLVAAAAAKADGPADNLAENVRRIPPPGIKLADADRAELEAGVVALDRELVAAAKDAKPAVAALLPEVRVYHKAVDWALRYNEFYRSNEVGVARELLKTANTRLQSLKEGHPAWTQATGLVVRAYVSKIDGSIQPYGLVIPPSWQENPSQPHRLDAWFHGRGEQLTELSFINDRQRNPGEFTPANTFVLHLYGRYCNANKFAGEMDLFEALEHVKQQYRIDENRIVIRGFSMGGAACWQFAVHYADRWAAAAPGAGFSESPDFLKVFQNESVKPTWYEKKLFHLYDCTDYALNLFHCPVVAYSGEIDKQKQAADIMGLAMKAEGMELTHLIGPNTAHKYHPETKQEINRRIDALAARGRDPLPRVVRFVTYTLRYPKMHWVHLDGLAQHWTRAEVGAEIAGDSLVTVTTDNVNALTLEMPAGLAPFDVTQPVEIRIDGQVVRGARPMSDRSWKTHLTRVNKRWTSVSTTGHLGNRKRPMLQGPIDDAFMDSFLFVRPTGEPSQPRVHLWALKEMERAVDHWRRHFRGDVRVKNDTEITDEDMAKHHLILWGDATSNRFLQRVIDHLPIRWGEKEIHCAGKAYGTEHHALALIAPNPLEPSRYVVLNSGFTFREYDHLNNARQIPKLPDYAVFDLETAPNARWAGKVVDAGFFTEEWKTAVPRK